MYYACVVTYVSCIKHVGLDVPKDVGVNTRVSVYANDVIGRVLAACFCIHLQLGEKLIGILCVFLYTFTVGGEIKWYTYICVFVHTRSWERNRMVYKCQVLCSFSVGGETE